MSIKKFGININWAWDRPKDARDERARSCGTKERLTQGEAESRVKSLERKYEASYDAYRCRYCEPVDSLRCWHVGHSTAYFTLADKYG